MGKNLTRKILESHLAKPSAMNPGDEIYVKVDQTLTHDINAVMTYLAFEAIGLDRTQVETRSAPSAVSAISTTTCYIWITRRRMTTFICSLWQSVMVCMFPDRATESAMRYM